MSAEEVEIKDAQILQGEGGDDEVRTMRATWQGLGRARLCHALLPVL